MRDPDLLLVREPDLDLLLSDLALLTRSMSKLGSGSSIEPQSAAYSRSALCNPNDSLYRDRLDVLCSFASLSNLSSSALLSRLSLSASS